jgi:hypothetical protein
MFNPNKKKKEFYLPGYNLLHADFLLGLFFDPEDGGDIFLLNAGILSTDNKGLYLRR